MNESHSLHKRFLAALGQYQRQGRFVSSAYGSDLGLTEGYIVVELAADPQVSAAQLSTILAVNKATISRALASLIGRRYIKVRKSSPTSRKKELHLTELAKTFLETGHRERQHLFSQCSSRISAAERKELTELLIRYCDSEEAPQAKSTPDEHALTICMRRLARSHQIVGTSFMDSGHSSTEWQILSLLNYSPNLLQAADFIEALTIQATTLSQTLQRMTSRGWIARQRQSGDRRIKPILLTPAGRRTLAHIEKCAIRVIEKGFAVFTPTQLERLVSLFERYSGSHLEITEAATAAFEAGITVVSSEDELRKARTFIIEQSVRGGTHDQLGFTICSPDNFVAILLSAGELTGVIEFSRSAPARCLNCIVLKKISGSPLESNFVLSAADLYLKIHGSQEPLQLPPLAKLHHSKKATLSTPAAGNKTQIMQLRSELLGERQALPVIA